MLQAFIAAFLEVWETNPDNIWQTSGAVQGLPELQKQLQDYQNQSDAELADALSQWCSDYEPLSRKILDKLGERKLKGSDNLSPNTSDQTTHQALINQYPEITQTLRNWAPKMGTQGSESQSS